MARTALAAALSFIITLTSTVPAYAYGASSSAAPAIGTTVTTTATASTFVAPPAAPPVRFTGPEALSPLAPLPSEFPPLPELKLPKYTTATLRNGLRVFLLPDPEVPLVRATLLMRGGKHASPPDKVGLATLAAYVQRAGGSAAHPAAALDSRLEELAASVELAAGPLTVSADLSCLAEDVGEVVGLLAEVVRSPALPADTLELYRSQLLNALEHQNDSPTAVSRRKLSKLMYGSDSVYARSATKASLQAITAEDLRGFVATWERPDAAVMGVVGAFEPGQMLALLEKEFGGWQPAAGQPAAPPPVPRGRPPATPAAVLEAASVGAESVVEGVAPVASEGAPGGKPIAYLVDRPGLTQADVLVGEPGISLSDPDVFALDVLDAVFNSFGGQLFDTLRSREGLAYSVSGGWDSPVDHKGLFVAGGQTSLPGEFLRSLRGLLARAAAEPPSEAELAAAKGETLNSFAFNFASSASQLQRILAYDLLGLPQDYLFRYFRGIEAVERGDVLRAAAAHLHPAEQTVVVVADRKVAQRSLEDAGYRVVPLPLDD